ncbi:hypothetical protein KP509_20G083900 [Ceratopteris richardii]|uniref:J domain-containing protein n=2 Tax=Ceratopteris richardii TaxID=49495 RepID=A0A8T2SHL3_CERRI|nr:hypothetical protein KP509_20G083900 [Ceratopteris richardii]
MGMLGSLMGSCTLLAPSPSLWAPSSSILLKGRQWSTHTFPSVHRHEVCAYRFSVLCTHHSGFFSFATRSSSWGSDESPYEVLGVERTVDEDEIKSAYRRLAKLYHPDVYDGSGDLGEGETPETRFIKIQAAYELLIDKEERRQYDFDNRVNPLKASKAWMEWILKKKKAFDQRGDMAVTAWAEQQQRELSLKARRLAKYKMDPEEERRILAKEKKASVTQFESTLRRHTLVLKKRDLMRRKMDEKAQKQLIQNLLAKEGLELAEESEDD